MKNSNFLSRSQQSHIFQQQKQQLRSINLKSKTFALRLQTWNSDTLEEEEFQKWGMIENKLSVMW